MYYCTDLLVFMAILENIKYHVTSILEPYYLLYISASQYIMAGKACEKFAVFVYGMLEKFRQKFIFFV